MERNFNNSNDNKHTEEQTSLDNLSLDSIIALKLASEMVVQNGNTLTVECPSLSDADELHKQLLHRFMEQMTVGFTNLENTVKNSRPNLYLVK